MENDISRFSAARPRGDNPKAADELLPLVYHELRRVAASKMAREAPGQTLQPTALVHEAWLRMRGRTDQNWDSSDQFIGRLSEAMRCILVDRARRKKTQRHGGGLEREYIDFSRLDVATTADDTTVLAVHELLDELAEEDPVGAELVKLRFFVGLTNIEACRILGIPERTAKRTWSYCRAWLCSELNKGR
ncbi:MAG: ECF-type sigma factor [Opitutales bacterium]